MLTTKQIARNMFITQCSTTNTLFAHKAKVKPKNVSKHTAFAINNKYLLTQSQFNMLASTYNLNKQHTQSFVRKLARTLANCV